MATRSSLIRLTASVSNENTAGRYTANFDFTSMSNVKGVTLKSLIFRNTQPNVFTAGSQANNIFFYDLHVLPQVTLRRIMIHRGFYVNRNLTKESK